jgi:hypothetical protein
MDSEKLGNLIGKSGVGLYASDGMCWDASIESAGTTRNEAGGFSGRTTPP